MPGSGPAARRAFARLPLTAFSFLRRVMPEKPFDAGKACHPAASSTTSDKYSTNRMVDAEPHFLNFEIRSRSQSEIFPVKPVVLAWALLFVVVFGLVYRIFSWLGRRFGKTTVAPADAPVYPQSTARMARPVTAGPPPPAPPLKAVPPLPASPSRPETVASTVAPTVEIRKPVIASAPPAPPLPPRPVSVQPVPTAPVPSRPLPNPPLPARPSMPAAGAAPVIPSVAPPRPVPASAFAKAEPGSPEMPPKPVPAPSVTNVPSPRVAAAAAAAAVPARNSAQGFLTPDVRATVDPGSIVERARKFEMARTAATLPSEAAVPEVATRPDVRATLAPEAPASTPPALPASAPVATAPDKTALNGNRDDAPPPVVAAPKLNKKRSTRLHARKVGAEAPSLDIRLKDQRTRKVRRAAKAVRKTLGVAKAKRQKVSSRLKSTEKLPTRRIGLKADVAGFLASTKAATKIVGVPQRSPRVLAVAAEP